MGFSFTATGKCDKCGSLLGASTDSCDHDGEPIDTRVFRRLTRSCDTIVTVESSPSFKWHKLKEEVDDDWIAYEYLGTRKHVNAMVEDTVMWNAVSEIPRIGMSLDAPNDVEEYDDY